MGFELNTTIEYNKCLLRTGISFNALKFEIKKLHKKSNNKETKNSTLNSQKLK